MTKVKRDRWVRLTVFVLGFAFCAISAEASPEKMTVALQRTIDAETGSPVYLPENPSGEVDITFAESSLVLKYTDRAGATKTTRIFFDALQLSGESGLVESTPVNDEIKRQFESVGAQQARQFIKMSAAKAGQSGQTLMLYFDSSKKVGFLNQNFVAGDVHVLNGAQSWTLRTAALRIISTAIYQQNAKMERTAPIGFTAGSFGTQRTCRELFTSAPQAAQ